MERRIALLVIAPLLLALVALGAMQTQTRSAEAAISAPSGLNASPVGAGVVRFDWNAGNENIWYCVNAAYSFADLATGGPTWRNYGCWTTEHRHRRRRPGLWHNGLLERLRLEHDDGGDKPIVHRADAGVFDSDQRTDRT